MNSSGETTELIFVSEALWLYCGATGVCTLTRRGRGLFGDLASPFYVKSTVTLHCVFAVMLFIC